MVYSTTQLRLVVDAVGRGGTGTRTTIRLSVSSLSWILSAGSTVIVTRRGVVGRPQRERGDNSGTDRRRKFAAAPVSLLALTGARPGRSSTEPLVS